MYIPEFIYSPHSGGPWFVSHTIPWFIHCFTEFTVYFFGIFGYFSPKDTPVISYQKKQLTMFFKKDLVMQGSLNYPYGGGESNNTTVW